MREKANERMTVRLPEETLTRIDTFIEALGFKNRSEFVRVAVEEYIERRKLSTLISPVVQEEKIEIELPYMAAVSMKYMIRQGYIKADAVSDALSSTAADWIFGALSRYTGKTPEDAERFLLDVEKSEKEASDMAKIVRK